MQNNSQNKMGTTPMLKLIISMSLPAMFSMLIQSLYNIVDSMFVAKLGENALTAVSLAFPIQILIIAVAVGTGIGINSLVSRRLGEKKQDEANSAATHGIILGIFNGLIFAILGILFTKLFFTSFTDDKTIVDMGYNYIIIITTFSIGSFVQINLEKTLQATGNMIYPMLFQLTGAITNIILDPIMIFGLFGFPKLGIKGAAIATITGQIIAMIFSLYIVLKKKHEVKISFRNFKFNIKTIKDIYAVGFPSMIMQAIASLLVIGLNSILIAFSDAAVDVLGVYYKLQSFIFMPVFGLTQGVMPIMGYNFGAKNKNRLISALKIGIAIASIIMLFGTILFMSIPNKLLMLFNATNEILEIGIPALRIISICFICAAGGIVFSTFFQAVGHGRKSLYISILRQLVIILPSAFFLSKLGINYVWYAFPISEIVALVVSIWLFFMLYNKTIKTI
ncbi:MATE family efflux transporter [Sedimentibacter sp. zth1]|uniref:MATE family efflux transporter n=1 Tax=Sedimentibacter sp. zth1 TaxID=2816908 RepID=UPI001A92920B|nr:MATE family efflux transporter [Sedimentibacter sp. zth1]QSX05378.1 MATE family efflux transporter [Sedimentibacter sp. zth1]